MRTMEATHFPTAAILSRHSSWKSVCGASCRTFGTNPSAKWKQNVADEPIDERWSVNALNRHSRLIPLRSNACVPDFRFSSSPTLLFTFRRIFSQRAFSSTSFFYSASNRKKQWNHSMKNTAKKRVIQSFETHRMASHKNSDQKGCCKEKSSASDPVSIDVLYDVLRGMRNKTNTIQTPSPPSTSSFSSSSYVNSRQRSGEEEKLRQQQPKNVSPTASILPFSSSSSCKSTDLSHFSQRSSSKASPLVSSILAIVDEDMTASPASCTAPPLKPVTPQEWYRHVTTHMKHVLCALEDVSSFISASPTASALASPVTTSQKSRGKGMTLWSLEAVVLHATREIDALPEDVLLPLSPQLQQKKTSSSGTTAVEDAQDWNPPLRCLSSDSQSPSDASSCTSFSFSQRVASHPPLFFAAILGSAWSCLLSDVWEMRKRYASHSHPQCQTSFVVSPSCLSTTSSSSPFFPSPEGEHPSHPAASTSVPEEMAHGTGKRPHCCTPCPCRSCLSWKLLGQRIRYGMRAYHQLVQQLLLTPEEKHVAWCLTPVSSTASSPNAVFEPPVSLSSCDMGVPSERVAGTTRPVTHVDGRWWEEEACVLGWWSSVHLPLMHISLGRGRLLRSLLSTSSSSSFEAAAGQNSSDEYAFVAEEEALLSLEKACQAVGRRVQEREVQWVRNEMRWNKASLCTHAVSSSSSLPCERSPARHACVESLEHPHEKSKKSVWRSWSSFQRARAAACSLLRFLSLSREQGWGMGKNWTEDDAAQAVVPVMCLLAMTRLLQRWECYDTERMRTSGRVSLHEALHPLAPRSSLVSATQAGSMSHTRASSTEAEAHPPPASSSSAVDSSSFRPFSRRPSRHMVYAWSSDRLYVALRDEVLEQLEQLKEWAGYALPLQGRHPSFALTIPPPTRRPPPPPIVHRTIHTALNVLLAELCEDREIPTCGWEAKTSSCSPLGATFSDSTSMRSTCTTRGGDDTGVRSDGTQRTTKGNATPLEIRVYLLLRLSALLRTTGEMYFSTPPDNATPPSSVGAPSSRSSPVWTTSLPSPPRPWVIALFGRLVRLCLEVEQDSSFQVYRQFHLRPHTPIDPVASFVAEEASIGTWTKEINHVKSLQSWKAFLLEEESYQGEKATPLSSFPFHLPPPAATMGTRCTTSCVAVPSSCHSFPSILSVDHTDGTEKGEKEKERRRERRKSWEEWYLPSVLLVYALQLRGITAEFIYHALLFWSAVTGESAAVPSPHAFRLPHTHGVSHVRDGKEGERDPWTAKETNACMEKTPQDAKKKKESEEETESNVIVHAHDENHKGEIVMRVFIGKFENIFYALLRREYLFGTQEKELLSMWYEKKVWRRHAPAEHHSTLARSSRVQEPGFVEEAPAPFSSSSSSFCCSTPNGTHTKIHSEMAKREKQEQDPNGGLDGCTNDPLLSSALPVSIHHVLHWMISSFSVDSCQKDVYTYCLKSFLWIREVSDSSSTPSRCIGKKSCFTACGIRLSQAIEVSYFLFLCEQRWPHLLTLRGPTRTLSRDPLSIPMMTCKERIKVERNGNEDDALTMDEDEENYLPHVPNAIQEYAHEVFLRLEHSTAKQLWHLRSVARHPKKKKKNGDGLFYFTGESQDRVYLQDPVLRSRHAQSILSVVHAHVVHPSLLWAPLWQVQELVAVFAFCRASLLLSQRKRTEERHHLRATPPTHPPSIQLETSLDSTLSHPDDDSAPVLKKDTEREESTIWDASLSKKVPASHRTHAVKLEGELLDFSGNKTNPQRDDQENEDDGAEAPPSERMVVVVGSQQSNLSLFHGYLILRIYVMSNVLRQWRETWVDALLVRKEKKEKDVALSHLFGDPHGGGVLLGETEREWCSTEVQTKLEALWRLEKFEPERERVASSSSSGEDDSADSLVTALTSSGRFRRRRRTWALEMVNDLMHACVPPCAALGVDHRANAAMEKICRSPSFSNSSIPVSTPKKGSSSPPPMPLRLLPARMEGTKDACWGAIRSIQRVEKMIQLMTRNKLFFHVLQDRYERWRQAEEEEEHHGIPKEDQERETVHMQGRKQMDSGEARSGDVYDDGDGIAPFSPFPSPFSSLLSNPSTSTLPVVPNEKQHSMRESIHLSIQRPDASSPMGFVLSAAEGRILRVQKRFHDDWEWTEGEKNNEVNPSASSRTASDGKELDFLTPIAVAARKAGIESVHSLVQYYVCAVDDHEVENGKDVARLLKGKAFFTLRLEKTNKNQASTHKKGE